MIIEAIVSAVIGACVAYLALSLLQMNRNRLIDNLTDKVDILLDAQEQYIEGVNKEVRKNIIEIAKLQAKVAKLDSLIKDSNSIKRKEEKKNVKK